jgi:hypothetical protein
VRNRELVVEYAVANESPADIHPEQAAHPEGLFDTILSTHQSTMTFPLRPSHPLLRGVESRSASVHNAAVNGTRM